MPSVYSCLLCVSFPCSYALVELVFITNPQGDCQHIHLSPRGCLSTWFFYGSLGFFVRCVGVAITLSHAYTNCVCVGRFLISMVVYICNNGRLSWYYLVSSFRCLANTEFTVADVPYGFSLIACTVVPVPGCLNITDEGSGKEERQDLPPLCQPQLHR